MAVDIENNGKMAGDVEHRQHADEKSSESDVADPVEVTWTEAEEKTVRNKVSLFGEPVLIPNEHISSAATHSIPTASNIRAKVTDIS